MASRLGSVSNLLEMVSVSCHARFLKVTVNVVQSVRAKAGHDLKHAVPHVPASCFAASYS